MSMCSGCSSCGSGTCQPEIINTIKMNMVFDESTDSAKCEATDAAINEALESMRDFLNDNRIKIQYNSVKLINEEQAKLLGFEGLPTILINGNDIQPEYKENPCKCNPDQVIEGWIYKGREIPTPSKELVIDAIIETVYGKPQGASGGNCQCGGECS